MAFSITRGTEGQAGHYTTNLDLLPLADLTSVDLPGLGGFGGIAFRDFLTGAPVSVSETIISSVGGWNGQKNVSLRGVDLENPVTLRNFVHVDVMLSDPADGPIDTTLTVENAKRGNLLFGSGNDTFSLSLSTNSVNDRGWSNQFFVDLGAGDDTFTVSEGEVLRTSDGHATAATTTDGRHTTIDVDLGAGDDLFVNNTAASSEVLGGAGNDRFVSSVGGNVFYGGSIGVRDAEGEGVRGGDDGFDNLQYFDNPAGIIVGGINPFSALGRAFDLPTGGLGYGDGYVIRERTEAAEALDYFALQEGDGLGGRDVDARGLVAALLTFGDDAPAGSDEAPRPDIDLAFGIETIGGTRFDDRFLLRDADDAVNGNEGNDEARLGGGDDRANGGAGDDVLHGEAGDDQLLGGTGINLASGGAGEDTASFGDLSGDGLLIEGVNPFSALGRALAGNLRDEIGTPGAADAPTFNYTAVDKGLPVNAYQRLQEGEYGANNGFAVNTFRFFADNARDGGIENATLAVGVEAVQGSGGNDTFLGRAGFDRFDGFLGNDYLDGRGGDDVLAGGAGNDTFVGGAGADTFVVAARQTGHDVIRDIDFAAGDVIEARGLYGNGPATFDTFEAFVAASREAGFQTAVEGDLFVTRFSADQSLAVELADVADETAAAPVVPVLPEWFERFVTDNGVGHSLYQASAWRGADRASQIEQVEAWLEDFTGTRHSDVLIANDEIGRFDNEIDTGTFGPDLIVGDGFHVAEGGVGRDTIDGSHHGGDDVIFGDNWERITEVADSDRGKADHVTAAGGDDLVFGQGGNDTLEGESGDDQLFGGGGDDYLSGGNGYDTLAGGAGDDHLKAGVVNGDATRGDLLEGGGGADVFDFSGRGGTAYTHTVTDFSAGEGDTLWFAASNRYPNGFDDLVVEQMGLDTHVSFSHVLDPGTVVLTGVDAGTLDENNVLFV